MIRPVDSDDEQSQSDEDDGRAVAVKEDPQFTLAVTRGLFHRYLFYGLFTSIEKINMLVKCEVSH